MRRVGSGSAGDHLTRRGFLRFGAVGLTLPQILSFQRAVRAGQFGPGGRAKSCIVLFAWGGVSHLDTWDPKPDAEREIRGEFQTIPTSVSGVRVSEHLPRLARQVHRLAIVRSVTHEASDHREAAYWNLTGHRPRLLGQQPVLPSRVDWPSIGAQVSRALHVPPSVEAVRRRRFKEQVGVDASSNADESAVGRVSRPSSGGGSASRVEVVRTISLSRDVLGAGRFPVGSFTRQDGYTNGNTVELIGMISAPDASVVSLTRAGDGPRADFSGLVAGDSTAGDWGSETHGRGGNLFLPGDGESNEPHSGFGGHANKFITFDLQEVRRRHFDGERGAFRFTCRAGVNGSPGVPAAAVIQTGVWVDGEMIGVSEQISRDQRSHSFELYVAEDSRYLTLAMLNGVESTYYDDVAFRDVDLSLVRGDVSISKPVPVEQEEELPETTLTREFASALPKAVTLPYPLADRGLLNGQYGGFLGARFDPAFIRPRRATPYKGVSPRTGHIDLQLARGLTRTRFSKRRRLLAELDGHGPSGIPSQDATLDFELCHQKALDMLMAPSVRAAFDLRQEPRTLRERYGQHICGQSALLARRLTEAGLPLVTVNCSAGDLNSGAGDHWDTHGNNFVRLKNDLLPPLDQAGAALLDDLAARGRLDETLVVFLTEFGRTPKINGSAGRDHYPSCYSVVFAGGGIQGGRVHGRSDRTGSRPAESPCGPEDLHATVFHALGIDPHFVVTDLEGRPLALTDGDPLPLF